MSEQIYEVTNSGKLIPKGEIVHCFECARRSCNNLCLEHLHPMGDYEFCSRGKRPQTKRKE